MSVLIARGAGVRRRRHQWLFRDLDVTVSPGETVAVVGPPGSGRTTLLLALTRRFHLTAGRVDITGRASLGYVPEVSAPEPVFTVTEHIRERLTLLGHSRSAAATVPLHGLDPDKQGQDLSPYEKQVLGLILATLATPTVTALDGFDDGLNTTEQAALSQLIADTTAHGPAVIVTAREVDESHYTTVIRLGAHEAQPHKSGVCSPQAVTGRDVPGNTSFVDGSTRTTPVVDGDFAGSRPVDGGTRTTPVVDGYFAATRPVDGGPAALSHGERDVRADLHVDSAIKPSDLMDGGPAWSLGVDEAEADLVVDDASGSIPVVDGDVGSALVVDGDVGSALVVDGDVGSALVVDGDAGSAPVVDDEAGPAPVVDDPTEAPPSVDGEADAPPAVDRHSGVVTAVDDARTDVRAGEEDGGRR
ncbi:ABC transporter ATP-binding protein [Paractinoplanes abujensis]|uniref:ABC-type branched-subunit amino acid transport system ATPase component n=1 Tax=Paractinoplanes abujensis TaxID=882441 RepID=A0A7W7D1M7_9ACTN|nr:ATP-binding cassette domain-containing protein [Actinoplanes abujensis]MBB4697323.1 ABC-type branched-subunit amino acid transport system ATPase component [Actinoplanes abujensis]